MDWTAFFLAAAMLASLAWTGHGASTPGPAGDLHLAADFLHLLAAGLWLGTLPPLILFLAEERHTGGPDWASVTATATRRYSTMAIASVIALLAGGLVNTWFLAGTVPALVGTEYGRFLLAKIGFHRNADGCRSQSAASHAAARRWRHLQCRLEDHRATAGQRADRNGAWSRRGRHCQRAPHSATGPAHRGAMAISVPGSTPLP